MWQHRSSSPQAQVVIPFRDCPAKTYKTPDGPVILGRSVVEHCQIVGEVARALIARYPAVLASKLFPAGAPLVAAAHDIGKVSPCFYEKIRRACSPPPPITALSGVNPALEWQWGGHAGVSQVSARALEVPRFVAEILGQHHGFSPPVAGYQGNDEVFGEALWQQERETLVSTLKQLLGSDWPEVGSVAQARLLAGLTSVADWIGSGEWFENPDESWQGKIQQALDHAGFVPPKYRPELSFEALFGFTPRVEQQQLIDAVTSPGIYVLEAPMGLGKTEAALFAAYRMVSSGQASGIYFALPTQLTSNKIHERFSSYLQSILASDCSHQALLLHGKSWLLDYDMGEEGRPGGAWFNQAKRGLLAPFSVGTIDQALMAAMHVKHGFVRAFGLAGKVVILDEVHSYDTYTSTLLTALVAVLRELHCTVIILSATLHRERREQLLGVALQQDAYPLITAMPAQQSVQEISVANKSRQTVTIRLLQQDSPAVEEALSRAQQGQQVLWIENTVIEAQERYLDLAARAREAGVECGLLHSRYTVDHRQVIEAQWVNLFGKAGWADRSHQGRILVGTQVLEQSLDIDADFMVSRMAPTDMLLQRLGRLWRHAETPRSPFASCEFWILAPDLEAAIAQPVTAFGRSAHVYSPYVLCRTLELWQHSVSLDLPQDIRGLIENTYAPRPEQGEMVRWLRELDEGTSRRKGRTALAQLARITLSQDGNTLPESKAQTRYSEAQHHEVLLLRDLALVPDEQVTILTLMDNTQHRLPWRHHALNKSAWRQLAATLMRQIVLVFEQDAPLPVPTDTLKKFGFQHCFYMGRDDWPDDECLLRVALVDNVGTLHGVHGARTHAKHQLDYRHDLGYRVIKQEKKGAVPHGKSL